MIPFYAVVKKKDGNFRLVKVIDIKKNICKCFYKEDKKGIVYYPLNEITRIYKDKNLESKDLKNTKPDDQKNTESYDLKNTDSNDLNNNVTDDLENTESDYIDNTESNNENENSDSFEDAYFEKKNVIKKKTKRKSHKKEKKKNKKRKSKENRTLMTSESSSSFKYNIALSFVIFILIFITTTIYFRKNNQNFNAEKCREEKNWFCENLLDYYSVFLSLLEETTMTFARIFLTLSRQWLLIIIVSFKDLFFSFFYR
jgi:hypothetical protein